MNDILCPDERDGARVVAVDESIDVISELLDTDEAGSGQRIALQNGEPDLDLVEPGAVGWREVEADIGVAGQPTITLGLVRRQIVEDDVDFLARMVGDDAGHEVEEFHAPAPLVVAGRHSAGGHVEGGKQRRGAVALVVVAAAAQRAPVGQLQIALGALQRMASCGGSR